MEPVIAIYAILVFASMTTMLRLSEHRPVDRFSLGRGHALCFVAGLIDECGAAVSAGARLAIKGMINHK